jgi:hypothetical protein
MADDRHVSASKMTARQSRICHLIHSLTVLMLVANAAPRLADAVYSERKKAATASIAVPARLDPLLCHARILTRASITFAKIYSRQMDSRVKPAGDGSGWASDEPSRPGTGSVKPAGVCI